MTGIVVNKITGKVYETPRYATSRAFTIAVFYALAQRGAIKRDPEWIEGYYDLDNYYSDDEEPDPSASEGNEELDEDSIESPRPMSHIVKKLELGPQAEGPTIDETPKRDIPASEFPASAMNAVEAIFGVNYPNLLPAMKAALATVAIGCIGTNVLPTSLFFVEPPSAGKSHCLKFLFPREEGDVFHQYFYRSDAITAAAFVTHSSDAKEADLKKRDLLPKIKNKALIVKELSPLFRGKREEVTKTFSILTAVLVSCPNGSFNK